MKDRRDNPSVFVCWKSETAASEVGNIDEKILVRRALVDCLYRFGKMICCNRRGICQYLHKKWGIRLFDNGKLFVSLQRRRNLFIHIL